MPACKVLTSPYFSVQKAVCHQNKGASPHVSRVLLTGRGSCQRPSPRLLPESDGVTHEVEEQFREWYVAKWGGGHVCAFPPSSQAGHFFFYYYVYSLLDNITKTGHIEVEGSHLVMNTEVSQDSVLGQILGSEQMSIISADGAG